MVKTEILHLQSIIFLSFYGFSEIAKLVDKFASFLRIYPKFVTAIKFDSVFDYNKGTGVYVARH